MDGQRGFCFGVDGRWAPPTDAEVQSIVRKNVHGKSETATHKQAALLRGDGHAFTVLTLLTLLTLLTHCTSTYYAYQATFLRAMDWRGVHELLIDAAVLRKTDAGGAAVQEERMPMLQPQPQPQP